MSEQHERELLFRAWSDATETAPASNEEAGCAEFLTRASRGHPPRRRWPLLITAALVFGALIVIVVWPTQRMLSFSTTNGPGTEQAWLATDPATELPLSFSEGSLVVIRPDSRGRVERLNANGASFLLERGAVRAHVVHRQSGTDWSFLAGPFQVQVTGTRLSVEWDPARERFSVRVDDGGVVVKGPMLEGSRSVKAGERCVVDLSDHSMSVGTSQQPEERSAARDAGRGVEEPKPPQSTPRSKHAAAAPTATWIEHEERGDYAAAYTAASRVGFASLFRASSADELLRLAQIGQLAGRRDTEREALLACRRRFPDTEPAAVAAYELGRASVGRDAANWFELYLSEQPAGPLAREALGRVIEARVAEGNRNAAKSAAKRYLSQHPGGPQASFARDVLRGSRE